MKWVFSAKKFIMLEMDQNSMQGGERLKLPFFLYNPNPLSLGVIKKETTLCPVCNRNREYVYHGPFYSIEEVEGVCPWCIADGSAANMFDGEFQDPASCESVEKEVYLNELIYKTPGYNGWQQEYWLSHCVPLYSMLDGRR